MAFLFYCFCFYLDIWVIKRHGIDDEYLSLLQPINRLVNDSNVDCISISLTINDNDDHKNRRSNRFENIRSNTLHPGWVITYLFLLHITVHRFNAEINQNEWSKKKIYRVRVRVQFSLFFFSFIGKSFSVLCSIHKYTLLPALQQIHFNCFKGFHFMNIENKFTSKRFALEYFYFVFCLFFFTPVCSYRLHLVCYSSFDVLWCELWIF